jgi:uncharacterized protein DUF6916
MTSTLVDAAMSTDRPRISRRRFIAGVSAAVAAGALLAAGGQLLSIAGPPAPLAAGGQLLSIAGPPAASGPALRRTLFAGRLGEIFQADSGSSTLPLQLVDVRDLHASIYRQAGVDGEQNFSLLFSGPIGRRLEQDTYRFAHSRIGSFPLFIVPMPQNQQAAYYEAIFSRQQA